MHSGEFEYVQSLLDAYKRQSYDLNKAHGDEIVSAVGVPVVVARVSVPTEYARDWVVTLGAVTTPGQQGAVAGGTTSGINPQLLLDSFCVVEWGMGASSNWAVVDWNKGQQFSVFGSFVKVHAQINAFGTAGVPPDPSTRFSGHIAPGRSQNIPLRTVRYGQIAGGGGSVELAVPPFARRWWFAFRNANAAATNNTQLFIGRSVFGGTILWQENGNTGQQAGSPMTAEFILPGNTNFLNWTNNAVGVQDDCTIVYELALS